MQYITKMHITRRSFHTSSTFLSAITASNDYDRYIQSWDHSNWWTDFVTPQITIHSSDNRSDHTIARELPSKIVTELTADGIQGTCESPIAMHHADLIANNTYVDEDSNIMCIIDWTFCPAVLLSALLTGPGLSQSRHEMDATLNYRVFLLPRTFN